MTVIFQSESVVPGEIMVPRAEGMQNFVKFDFHNDSIYEAGITFGNSAGSTITGCDFFMEPFTELLDVIPPQGNKYTVGGNTFTGPIFVFFKLPGGGTILASQAPASEFTIVGYPFGVQSPTVIANNRMQNIGNVVGTVGGVANSVQDDERIAGSLTIEATSSTGVATQTSITNNGSITLGNVTNPGQIFINGIIANWSVDTNGAMTSRSVIAPGTSGIHLLDNTLIERFRIDSTGATLVAGSLFLLTGSLSYVSIFNGTATTTPTLFSHGLGAIPDIVIIQRTGTNSAVETFGYDPATMTNLQVKIVSNGTFTFTAIAIKL